MFMSFFVIFINIPVLFLAIIISLLFFTKYKRILKCFIADCKNLLIDVDRKRILFFRTDRKSVSYVKL